MGSTSSQPPEPDILRGGPARPWRPGRLVVLLVGLAVGIAAGASVSWRVDRPAEVPSRASDPVRLVLTGAAASDGSRPLRVDAVLLHDRGPGAVTVTRIHRPGTSLEVTVRALPVTLSVNRSFERVELHISPRRCALATRWTPSSQPFTLTWRDERGDLRTTVAGDHDEDLELALIRYMDAACGGGGR